MPFLSTQSPIDSLELTVPMSVAFGRQAITVAAKDVPQSISTAVMVAPQILGLRAHKDGKLELSRVVLSGGEVLIQFSDKIPTEIKQSLEVKLIETKPATLPGNPNPTQNPSPAEQNGCADRQDLIFSIPEDDYLVVRIPEKCSTNITFDLAVISYGTHLEKQTRIRVQNLSHLLTRASLIVVGLIALIYLLYKFFYRVPAGKPRFTFLKTLLVEQENQTYSLSRAQFVGWLVVIVWCYLFLYYANGFIERNWSYPKLGNAMYAFMISLGTLIAAQATNRGMGVKGAGEEHPSLADLVVHGGVVALDRVQQLIWTLIALGMFVRITVDTYDTASALPAIPTELLALMGLSSAGYLGGKLVRGPGPIIEQVTHREREGKVVLNIKGRHLSKEGFIWVDGVQQPKDQITKMADDADEPAQFAKELELSFATTLAEWKAKDHDISIVNSDAQRADFRIPAETSGQSGVGETAEISEVTVGQPDANGNVTLTIECTGVSPGATITITSEPSFHPVQDSAEPNLFTVQVSTDWTKEAHQLLLHSNGNLSSFTHPPSN